MSSHFEFGGRQNANMNTKVLLSYFPKFSREGKPVIDPRTGLVQVQNTTTIWNTLESKLAGIVDYYDSEGNYVYAFDQMMDELEALSVLIYPNPASNPQQDQALSGIGKAMETLSAADIFKKKETAGAPSCREMQQ